MRRIYWEITNKCNLRCKHCFLYDELVHPTTQPHDELNTGDCLAVVEQLEKTNVFFVVVQGGEPFARPDILLILQHLGEKQFWTQVDTNGTLIDKGTARGLANTGINSIFVSLEGPTAKINDIIRGKGAFKKAIRGINYLRDFEIPFCIQMTINKSNYNEIENMVEFCSNIGSKGVFFLTYVDIPSKNPFSSLRSPGPEELFESARRIAKIRKKYPKNFILSDIDNNLGFLSPELKNTTKDKRFIRCGLGSWRLTILSNGDVLPCSLMRDKVLGNVLEIHLSKIKTLPEFQVYKNVRTITVDEANEECKACEWRYFCGGGCSGRAYVNYGSFLAPDPQKCSLARYNLLAE